MVLISRTGLDRKQLDSWFCNTRKRIWQGTSTVTSWRSQAARNLTKTPIHGKGKGQGGYMYAHQATAHMSMYQYNTHYQQSPQMNYHNQMNQPIHPQQMNGREGGGRERQIHIQLPAAAAESTSKTAPTFCAVCASRVYCSPLSCSWLRVLFTALCDWKWVVMGGIPFTLAFMLGMPC